MVVSDWIRVHVDVEEFLAVVGKSEVCAGGAKIFFTAPRLRTILSAS